MSKWLLFAACLAAVSCTKVRIREAWYGNGAVRTTSQFIGEADSAAILHGAQISWYPDGKKEAMDIYVNGYQQGYAYRWYPDGGLKSVEHFTDGASDGQTRRWEESGALAGRD
jgi:antitoxin component YwqK of YwqJK toxin-antitoxin module